MSEIERRKSLRLAVYLRAYFPDLDIKGRVSNISLDGCYVRVAAELEKEGKVNLVIDLPVVGPVSLKGYVHHKSGNEMNGVGIQFIHVGFTPDESIYYGVFSRSVKILSQLQEVRDYYHQMTKLEGILPAAIPDDTDAPVKNDKD
ncbi:MAG: hypothetical protein DSY90_07190 [Deltaproteobacteria bacterium]|nr:MAG: hypothetical protein DSY90_07190 [Deltaproteobacteria bacterium]RUA01554.1 MAG: hypothetical protein DSY89_04380 [Deltaproteobacteria bacterium]